MCGSSTFEVHGQAEYDEQERNASRYDWSHGTDAMLVRWGVCFPTMEIHRYLPEAFIRACNKTS